MNLFQTRTPIAVGCFSLLNRYNRSFWIVCDAIYLFNHFCSFCSSDFFRIRAVYTAMSSMAWHGKHERKKNRRNKPIIIYNTHSHVFRSRSSFISNIDMDFFKDNMHRSVKQVWDQSRKENKRVVVQNVLSKMSLDEMSSTFSSCRTYIYMRERKGQGHFLQEHFQKEILDWIPDYFPFHRHLWMRLHKTYKNAKDIDENKKQKKRTFLFSMSI